MNIKNMEVGDIVGFCPRCNNELIIRKGKYGLFIGCSNYPRCKKTFNYEGFRVQPEAISIRKILKAETYEEIKEIMDNTDNDKVKQQCEKRLIELDLCTCGEKLSHHGTYRTTPEYPHYLKEYYCPHCGFFIMTETPHWKSFCRWGRLEHNPHDEAILGGYWI